MTDKKIKDIIDKIDGISNTVEHALDRAYRRQTGSYYTSLDLALPMVEELLSHLPQDKRKNIHNLTFLEPCVGTGNFVFAYILTVAQDMPKKHIKTLLNNIYVCDINQKALETYRQLLTDLVKDQFGILLDDAYFQTHIGTGLVFDLTSDNPHYIPIDNVFGKNFSKKFDIVITNPPYKNLKAEHSHYATAEAKDHDKTKYMHVARIAKQVLPLSSYGTLNLYKLFVEDIISQYSTNDGLVSLLVPSSILTDKTCEKLRAMILENHHIISIKNIPENNRFIDAQQALTVLLISKSPSHKNSQTSVCKLYTAAHEKPVSVNLKLLANKDNNYTIFLLNQDEFRILNHMLQFPKIKDLDFITNSRGELDLTANKSAILLAPTPFKLLRGKNIGNFTLLDSGQVEYVDSQFVNSSPKRHFISADRLVCQQVSNVAKKKRLNFVKVEKDNVLANSCNFIAVAPNEYTIDLYFMAGLLNSKLMNWFFKIQSSNNHINNYEIDSFPIPIHSPLKFQLSELSKKAHGNSTPDILDAIDELVNEMFGISDTGTSKKEGRTKSISPHAYTALTDLHYIFPSITVEDVQNILLGQQTTEATLLKYDVIMSSFERKVFEGIIQKYIKLQENIVLNHTTFKLSDLDLEMIKPIPQGGNWKNIPTETVLKSKRLTRITETGGRTTLYGRLDYTKPSYTITTYFNRPGNGTYVHPIHNRVLSVREAARLQGFPDDYYFYGNKTQLLKQIGNAVPGLLAYQIGKKIVQQLGNVRSLDLFCGAGGLTYGLKAAGIHTALCTDFNEAACATIKINNPESDVVYGDIMDDTIKEIITTKALQSGADVVCGGPPCQGFSMAGYRNLDDPRNQLFREFVTVVEKTKPKVVIFENVEGILTFGGGETYEAIHTLFSELGYKTEGRLLRTDHYGVPQKRKRVIIICTREDLNLDPSLLYPDEITKEDDKKTTVKQAIYDLEDVACSEEATYSQSNSTSNYIKMLRGKMTPGDFISIVSKNDLRQLSFFDSSKSHEALLNSNH